MWGWINPAEKQLHEKTVKGASNPFNWDPKQAFGEHIHMRCLDQVFKTSAAMGGSRQLLSNICPLAEAKVTV